MGRFEYVPAQGDAIIQMDGPDAFVGTAESVRSRAWDYEMGKRGLVSARRGVREVEADFATDYATMDALRYVADADVALNTPGTFIAQGEWKQRGFVLASEPKDIHFGRLTAKLTIALLDGAWWRIQGTTLVPSEDGGGETVYLDYGYDFPHDYGRSRTDGAVDTRALVPCAPRIVFHGPVSDPYVIIAGNKYQVMGNVASGARIEIDGRDKTVKLIAANGDVTDKFTSAVRGSGEGGGEYIFQPIPVGENIATWDGTFTVEVQWYEEVGEPPWNQS